jgi:hypothetical protein
MPLKATQKKLALQKRIVILEIKNQKLEQKLKLQKTMNFHKPQEFNMRKFFLFALLFFALFGCIEKDGKNNFKVARIKYEVTGTASSVSLTLTNPDGGTEQFSNVRPPGSYEFSVPIQRGSFNYYHAYISAQNMGPKGNVTVTIYVNGRKFRTATSNGAYVIADADGAVEYKDLE